MNLIEGSGIAITTADDPADNELDVTIAATGGGGVTDHGALTGLTDDDHTQYALLSGRSGGQIYSGGTASGNALELRGNSATNTGSVKITRGQDGAVLLEVYNAGVRFYRNAIPDNDVGPAVQFSTVPTATLPTVCPSSNDSDTGIGLAGSNQLSGIAGGVEVLRASAAISGVSDGLRSLRCVEANTAVAASPNLLGAAESRNLLHNTGATAENYHTLPASAPIGYEQWFACQDADGIRIVAQAGEVISLGPGAVSVAGGFVKSTVIGSVVGLVKITSTKYIAISVIGTWTVDT